MADDYDEGNYDEAKDLLKRIEELGELNKNYTNYVKSEPYWTEDRVKDAIKELNDKTYEELLNELQELAEQYDNSIEDYNGINPHTPVKKPKKDPEVINTPPERSEI